MFRLAFFFLALLVSTLAAFGFYFHRRFVPLMQSPEVALFPVPVHLVAPANLRPLNLGYARCSVPAAFTGELAQLDETFTLALAEGKNRLGGSFSAPLSDHDPATRAMLENKALGEPVTSLMDFYKRFLTAAPFSTWSIPFRGMRRSKADIALLSLKYQSLQGATAVHIYETAQVTTLITYEPNRITATFADRQRGVSQSLVIGRKVPHADEIIAAIANSYAFTAPDCAEATLREALKAAGIPSLRTAP